VSEIVGGGIGGFLGGLIGGALAGRTVTIFSPNGAVVARVLIEPWDFLGVSVMQLPGIREGIESKSKSSLPRPPEKLVPIAGKD